MRIEPLARKDVVELRGRLVIPPADAPIDDDLVRALRDADQR